MKQQNKIYNQEMKNLMPRERAVAFGIQNLCDKELLALLLGSGNKQACVKELAERLQKHFDSTFDFSNIERLCRVPGIGIAKASLVAAAFELSRRYLYPPKKKIGCPLDLLPFLFHYSDRKQELFFSILLNGANEILLIRPVTVGILNRTIIHPREVFAEAVEMRAGAIIVAHNHPSGNLSPSKEDLEVTRQLKEVGNVLGIKLLDHLIFCNNEHYSFLENGLI